MVSPSASPEAAPILQLLTDYSFDTDHCQAEAVVVGWLQQFEPTWVSQAITEALYQGRYKLVSVDHILQLWQRRGQPLRHFNREFETIVLGQTLIYQSVPEVSDPLPPVSRGIPPLSPARMALLRPELSNSEPPLFTVNPDNPGPDSPDIAPLDTDISNTDVSNTDSSNSDVALPDDRMDDEHPWPSPTTAASTPAHIPNFRPLTPETSSDWAQADSIQPFVPQLETSEFHQRLKAVVKAGQGEASGLN